MLIKYFIKFVLVCLMFSVASFSQADNYPDRAISLIVPNPPGGLVDTSARLVSDPLSQILHQTVIVDNKPGGSGNVAYQQVAKGAKDGYSILVSYSGYHVANPILQDKLPWSLKDLMSINPKLIVLRISGYGQTGPYRDRPGFGVVAEAMGGLRHLTAEPGRVPVRVGVSIGDTLAALHGVIGILLALHERHQSGLGQVIDIALFEAVFNCMESLLPEYSAFGEVRQAAGSALPGIAPSNAYLCKDGSYVLIAGNGDSIFKRLMNAIGQSEMANNPEYADNTGRVKHIVLIDQVIGDWTILHDVADVLNILEAAKVPAGKIYTAADIAHDPHFIAREMILSQKEEDGSELLVPGIVPKLSRTPGAIHRKAPEIGQDNEKVLKDIGLSDEQINALYEKGIIWSDKSRDEK